jgi:hypothetical protein
MIMFEKFMKVHAKDTDVIYVGGRPNPEAIFGADFSAISSWTSEHYSGLHCLTIETEASSNLC